MKRIEKNQVLDIRPIGDRFTVPMSTPQVSGGVSWVKLPTDQLDPATEVATFGTFTSGGIFAQGQNVNSGTLNVGFSFTTPITTGYLSIDGNTVAVPPGSSSLIWPYTISSIGVQSKTATLAVTGLHTSGTDVGTFDLVWRRDVVWGTSSIDSVNTVTGLQNRSLSANGERTITGTCASGEYLFYGYADSVGTPKFVDQDTGISGGFVKLGTAFYTNRFGVAETYGVYRTVNHGLGALSIGVTF